MFFCDTSALAKMYVVESYSSAVKLRLSREDKIYASDLSRVECMAMFHRRLREKLMSRHVFDLAVRQFHSDSLGGFWTWLPVSAAVISSAQQTFVTLPSNVFLRSSDCIHLATAAHHNFSEIYTFDAHQKLAAPAFGLAVGKL